MTIKLRHQEVCGNRDKINNNKNENDNKNINNNNRLYNNRTVTIKSLQHKTKIIGSTADNKNRLNAELAAPLKCLSNF